MERSERNERLGVMSSINSTTSSSSQANVSPYKVCISAIICVFIEEKGSKTTQREVAHFCLLIMKLIQNMDIDYNQLMVELNSTCISNKTKRKCVERINEICIQGLSVLMEMMSSIKQMTFIQRHSIVGLFLRRMWLYFDKLSFSSVSMLFDDLILYVNSNKNNIKMSKFNVSLAEMKPKTESCPQQMQFFISKQLNLIEVNEKQAMSPHQLLDAIKRNFADSSMVTSSGCSELNDVHFLRYMNSLRMNEYPASKESLMAYFDGHSNQIPRCWAALNLAILNSHFNHHELALDSIKECISTAQEANDEKCLEYALMWVSRILSQANPDCDVDPLLNHLQSKANELSLPYVSSLAQLQAEKQRTHKSGCGTSSATSASTLTPDILAVKHSMNDVLMMSYSSRAAILNLYGASNLAALSSQVLLHLNVVEPIGEVNVYHVNENTCICIRNIALHLWRNVGQYQMARDMLLQVSSLFSEYKSDVNSIWRQALAEIDFEHHLFSGNWKSASSAVEMIRSCDETEANIRLAQLKIKQGDKMDAIRIINNVLNSKSLNKLNSIPYTKIIVMQLKAKIFNDLTLVLECIDLSRQNHLIGLQCSCLVQLASMLQKLSLISQSHHILNSIMIHLLANGTCQDIAMAHHIEALNHFIKYQRKLTSNEANDEMILEKALKSNEQAIIIWRRIGDKESLTEALTLQAKIYHVMQDFSKRNYFARQVRLILDCN